MKSIKILLVILTICFISCKEKIYRINANSWKDNSKIHFEAETKKLYTKNQKNLASSYSYNLINYREKIIKNLDSIINIDKIKKVAVLEEFIFHQPFTYSAEIKIDKKIYLFIYKGDKLSIKESNYTIYTTELFDKDVDYICNEKKYNDSFKVRKISLYSRLELKRNDVFEPVYICFNLNPSGSDL